MTLDKLMRCCVIYVDTIHPETKLTEETFDDIFCSELNNTKPAFDVLKDSETGLLNIFEAVITMAVFAPGHFDLKIRAIFSVFDLDGSGEIDRGELSAFIQASCNGLCKICSLPRPSSLGILHFTTTVFETIDNDNSGQVDYEEFESWIKNSDAV
jgi:Ca2+-binding EF-hand superfamily protein